jgi:hypothetical protein
MNEGTIKISAEPYITKTVIEWVTLRDQFAMAALTGLLAAPNVELWIDVSKQAYAIADLMLEARKGKK